MTSFYSNSELRKIGFKSIGTDVLISKKTSIYGASRICIGSNVRIDDYCVISAGQGGINIGNYVHIAVFSSLQGNASIIINDFAGLSSRVSIYSSNDDYGGDYMTNPTVPIEFTNVFSKDVLIEKHVIIGSGSIVLPGVKINKGAAIGALSMVNRDCEELFIYKGNPAKKIIKRNDGFLKLEKLILINS